MKRGYTYAEAMAYVGVKRRTFDEKWRPRLVAMTQGSSKIYDRSDLDALFDEFKKEAAAEGAGDVEQNAPGNGRPCKKGATQWARRQPASTEPAQPGKSTSGTEGPAFASVVSLVTKKQKAG